MSYLVLSTAPSLAAYEAVDAAIGTDKPAGLLFHAVAPAADGTVRIASGWESEEALRAFEAERLMPAFAQAGTVPAGAAPEVLGITKLVL